mmetsp:Transcript_23192/g.32392  ORF Transcript_23192/g.32392 Transcript_23192/m.32392 type:complete len:138 (-) Transcript_23192:1250-1663(-)
MSSTIATANVSHKCSLCGQEATKKCSRCKMAWYCSVEHQKQHWKYHKKACNDAFQADQYALHKREFDRIIQKYGLDSEQKSEDISTFLTKDPKGVNAPEFAEKFGMMLEEAVVFLEWIKVGVKFKEESIDTAKQAGF